MRRHSERARRNSRNGINMRIEVMRKRITELNAEISTYKRYLGRGLNDRWIKHVIAVIQKKLRYRQRQLKEYTDRKSRWGREGKI